MLEKFRKIARRCLKHLLWIFPLCLVLGYLFREPLLRAAARVWVQTTEPTQAQAIIILGGGINTRPFAAAELYKKGLAPRILIANAKESPIAKLGLYESETAIIKKLLINEGVPESAIELFGTDLTSTKDETLALLEWVKSSSQPGPLPTLLIPTEYLHTRRTKRIFDLVLGQTAQPKVIGYPHQTFSIDSWWKKEDGLIVFQTEIAKSIYYLWNY
jgi:hypothetical protein